MLVFFFLVFLFALMFSFLFLLFGLYKVDYYNNTDRTSLFFSAFLLILIVFFLVLLFGLYRVHYSSLSTTTIKKIVNVRNNGQIQLRKMIRRNMIGSIFNIWGNTIVKACKIFSIVDICPRKLSSIQENS